MLLLCSCAASRNAEHVLHVLTTNDVHGHYFDSLYVGDKVPLF